jgi:hypothetical protein
MQTEQTKASAVAKERSTNTSHGSGLSSGVVAKITHKRSQVGESRPSVPEHNVGLADRVAGVALGQQIARLLQTPKSQSHNLRELAAEWALAAAVMAHPPHINGKCAAHLGALQAHEVQLHSPGDVAGCLQRTRLAAAHLDLHTRNPAEVRLVQPPITHGRTVGKAGTGVTTGNNTVAAA